MTRPRAEPMPPRAPQASTPQPTARGRDGAEYGARAITVVVALAALSVSLSQSLLVPVLGVLPVQLDTAPSNVAWLLTSTLLVGAAAVPIIGRLGDLFGTRRMLLLALFALAGGSLITALTSNVGLLIAGRAVQGISLAAVPLGISLLARLLPPHRVSAAIALVSAMLGVGGALALPIAGLVAEHSDFHWLFWITAVTGAACFVAVLKVVPEAPRRGGGRLDVLGSVLLAGALVCLLLPLAQAAQWGWSGARPLGMFAASAVLLVVFTLSQTRIRQPLVDLKALRRPQIVLTNIASVLIGFALFASLIGTSAYVEAPVESGYGFGSSLMAGGLALLPGGIMMLLFAPVAARLITRRGPAQTLAIGAAFVALGWIERITLTGSFAEVVLGSTIVGIGTGIGYAAMPALINKHTPPDELASANGLNSLFRSLGSTLASAIGGSILAADTVILGGFAVPSLAAYRLLFGICALAAVVAGALILFVRDRGVS